MHNKKLYIKIIALFLISLLLSSCSGFTLQGLIDGKDKKVDNNVTIQKAEMPAPSSNRALNAISPSRTLDSSHSEDRVLQKETDEWLKNEWEPLTQETNSTQSVNKEEDNSSFTLQKYVDKATLYIKNKEKRDANKTKAPSHYKKMESMPAIGNTKKR